MSTIVSFVKQARKTAELEIKILRNGVEVPLAEVGKSGEKLKAELLSSNVAAMRDITSPLAGLVESLRNQSPEITKILASQPEILIPKYDFGVVSGEIKHLGMTKDALWAAHLSAMRMLEESDARNARLRDAAAGLPHTNDSILQAFSAAALANADSIIRTATDQMDLFRHAILSVNTRPFNPFDTFRKFEEINKRFRNALIILEVDPDDPEEYYRDAPLDALEQEAAVVLWMKKTVQQGRLPEKARLDEYQRTGQISTYTLGRFWRLLLGESPSSVPRAEYWVPPTNKFELQIQLDSTLPPQRLIYPVAPGQTPVVRVLVQGASQLLQPTQLPELWTPDKLKLQPPMLSPAEQDWLIIILQSEYEHHRQAKKYMRFCIDYGLTQANYEFYKAKFRKQPSINLKQWAIEGKPEDADQRFDEALKQRRTQG